MQEANLYEQFKQAQRDKKRTKWSIDYTTAKYCLFIEEIKVISED